MATTKTSITVTCPNCAKILRLSARPAKGKKIKCPACEEIFLPKFNEEGAGITAKPSKLKAVASGKSSAKRSRADEEDDEEDEEEEERRSVKKKKKAKAGSNMVMILSVACGGFLFLSLGLGLGAAFVWPGFMLSKPNDQIAAKGKDGRKGKGQSSGLASYVVAEASVVMGANFKGLRESKQENKLKALTSLLEKTPDKLPAEMLNLLPDCEKFVISSGTTSDDGKPKAGPIGGPKGGRPGKGKLPPPPPLGPIVKIVVAAQLTAEGIEKVKKLPEVGGPEQLADKYTIHRRKIRGEAWILAFLSDRTVVATNMLDADAAPFLDKAAQNSPETKLSKVISLVEQKHFWAVQVRDAMTRKFMKEMDTQKLADQFKWLPQSLQLAEAMKKFDVGYFTVEGTANGNLEVNIQLEFEDAAAAKSGKEAAEGAKAWVQTFLQNLNSKDLAPALNDFKGLAFQADDTKLSAKVTVTADSVKAGQDWINDNLNQPPEDGNKKGPPPPENLPKFDISKIVPTKVFDYKEMIQQGVFLEEPYVLQMGKRVTITATSQKRVDLYVYRGERGDNPIAVDISLSPNARVDFIVPATGSYRVRIVNQGPGNMSSCRVAIYQQ